MSRKNGKPCWAVLVSMVLTLAFFTGCSSTPATVTPATITTVSAEAPFAQNAMINTAFTSPFKASVTANGNPVANVVVTFSAPGAGAGGTFAGSTSVTATTGADGVAIAPTFTANGTFGTYNVIASVGSSTSTALFFMSNTLVPQAVTTAGGTPQSTTAGTQFATNLSVTVLDATSTAVSGLPVTFTAPDGTFTDTNAITTTATTNASGVATAAPYVASSTVGTYTVTAQPSGLSSTATFDLSNTIMPATITANGGTPQSVAVGTPFAPLSVTVMDGSTPPKPVPNAVVTFAAPAYTIDATTMVSSAASGSFDPVNIVVSTTAWTDASGVATAPTFTANDLASGPYNVSATVVVQSGTTLSVNFALTNQ